MDMDNERYSRQVNLFGIEGQEKLAKSSVVIVGSNSLSDFLLASLASLGIGNIFLAASRREGETRSFLVPRQSAEGSVGGLENFFYGFDRNVNFFPIFSGIKTENSTSLLPYADVLIDVTHDANSKYFCMDFARKNNIPAMLGYATGERGMILHVSAAGNLEEIICDMEESEEGIFASEIIAGLITDEARKLLLPRENEKPINYNFDFASQDISRKEKVLMVGAGALGNWLGIGMALTGVGATIVDDDVIDTTNLNRQFMFYDAVGAGKAKTLARKLSKLGADFDYIDSKFDSSLAGRLNSRYGMVVSCVDNKKTRILMNEFAYARKMPLVNGGTDPFAGNVEVYIPGKSACLRCQSGLEQTDEESSREISSQTNPTSQTIQTSNASCIRQAENSIVVSNTITAGLMLEKISCILSGVYNKTERAFYSSENGISYLNISPDKACGCYKDIQSRGGAG